MHEVISRYIQEQFYLQQLEERMRKEQQEEQNWKQFQPQMVQKQSVFVSSSFKNIALTRSVNSGA